MLQNFQDFLFRKREGALSHFINEMALDSYIVLLQLPTHASSKSNWKTKLPNERLHRFGGTSRTRPTVFASTLFASHQPPDLRILAMTCIVVSSAATLLSSVTPIAVFFARPLISTKWAMNRSKSKWHELVLWGHAVFSAWNRQPFRLTVVYHLKCGPLAYRFDIAWNYSSFFSNSNKIS